MRKRPGSIGRCYFPRVCSSKRIAHCRATNVPLRARPEGHRCAAPPQREASLSALLDATTRTSHEDNAALEHRTQSGSPERILVTCAHDLRCRRELRGFRRTRDHGHVAKDHVAKNDEPSTSLDRRRYRGGSTLRGRRAGRDAEPVPELGADPAGIVDDVVDADRWHSGSRPRTWLGQSCPLRIDRRAGAVGQCGVVERRLGRRGRVGERADDPRPRSRLGIDRVADGRG